MSPFFVTIRSQKQTTNGANIHSKCAVLLPENHDPNFYLHTTI